MARLLFVTGTSPNVRGGSGTFVGITVLAEALRHAGHEVTILAPEPGGGPVSLARRLAFNVRARRASRAATGVDAVVGFDMDGVFLEQGSARRVVAVKGGLAEEARFERGAARVRLTIEARLEGRNVRRADRVLATSVYSRQRILEDYGAAGDRVVVVPEPIDLSRWQRALDDAAAAPEEGAILCVAHLYPRKDVATLLDAVSRLPPPARLIVVGTGPERRRLERRARELGLGERAVFLGHLPFERLASEYRRASVFCLPSRQEGFGIVFLEAMAAGLPIVAARAAAVPELVLDGESGILVPPGDSEALSAALGRLLGSPGERARFAECGRLRVRSYDAPRVANLFLEAIGL
ncbi:MAG: glycosyltransferase family 4 protein [Acidobacteriota bacterium]|nr:glycosyltransferase family 4 protein [Acidobacteriota bacterium]